MPTYFWSDTHFNHAAILGFPSNTHGRNQSTVEGMNEALIDRWNNKITDNDTVWLLGDFGFRVKDVLEAGDIVESQYSLPKIFARLKGRKKLVVGNHDKQNKVLDLPWDRIEKLHTFKENGSRAILSHYPIESWYGMHEGTLMLHGHCHGTLHTERLLPHRFDVGADVWLYPATFESLVERASYQMFVPIDHHGDKRYHPDPIAPPRVGDSSELLTVAARLYNRWRNTGAGSPHARIDDKDAKELREAIAKAEGKA
jgi:calcineurin-like phosphoesterase family protein